MIITVEEECVKTHDFEFPEDFTFPEDVSDILEFVRKNAIGFNWDYDGTTTRILSVRINTTTDIHDTPIKDIQ
jgi:hypothetical protein